jgi:hypothetical protein
MREYRYLPAEGITFGVDIKDGHARVTMSACNDADSFSPGTGRDLIDLLFDKSDTTLRACSLKRNVVRFPYDGNRPRRDILKPLINYLTDELGERGFFRSLKSYYDLGITSNKDAVAISRELEDESIYLDYARMMEHLDELEQDVFAGVESEEELYSSFFPWDASVNNLYKRLKAFATAVWTEELVLGAEEEAVQEKRIAPRRPNPEPTSVKSFVVEPDPVQDAGAEIEAEAEVSVEDAVTATSDNN